AATGTRRAPLQLLAQQHFLDLDLARAPVGIDIRPRPWHLADPGVPQALVEATGVRVVALHRDRGEVVAALPQKLFAPLDERGADADALKRPEHPHPVEVATACAV